MWNLETFILKVKILKKRFTIVLLIICCELFMIFKETL